MVSFMNLVESCFERPNDFKPERWIDDVDLVKDKRGFATFSVGRYFIRTIIAVMSRPCKLLMTILRALLVRGQEPGFDGTSNRHRRAAFEV